MNHAGTNRVQEQTARIKQFLTETAPYRDLMGQHYEQLAAQGETLARDAASAAEQERLLRIAIIGQVKAGKSSFLNAALFGGDGVLPKAATPMTAALTIIRHAPAVRAEVEFYDQDEWQTVEKTAGEYQKLYEDIRKQMEEEAKSGGLFGKSGGSREVRPEAVLARVKAQVPEAVKAACEVVEMASKRGLTVSAYLGGRQVIEGVADVHDLMNKLEDFVGVNGRFTPIVRSTIIEYDNPALIGIEIIDTPGINDPVVSRGRRTKEHLGQCDVVFMLSACRHLMDAVDMQLIAQNLPSKGIRDIVLVGTQIDMEIYGEHQNYENFNDLRKGVQENLADYVAGTFENLQEKVTLENEREILQRLKQALPPIFISAMANNIARHFGRLDAEEQHFLNLYNKMFIGLTFEPELLRDLSNMSQVTTELDKQKDKKEEILRGRLDELLKGAATAFQSQTATLREDVGRQLTRIGQEDLKSLQEKEKSVTGRINKGRNNVEGSFEGVVQKVRKDFSLVQSDTKELMHQFTQLAEHTQSETESREVKVPRTFLGFDVSWIAGHRRETRTRTITYRYAHVHDAIDQVEMFVVEVERKMKTVIMDVVNLPQFRADVREAAMSLFDLSDPSFDVDAVAMPVERAVNRITVPSVDFGDRDYTGLITSKFSGGRVMDNAVDSLRQAQREAIRAVFSDFEVAVRQKTTEITASLEKTQTEFVDKLLADILKDLNTLREQLNDRENAVRRHKELLGVLDK